MLKHFHVLSYCINDKFHNQGSCTTMGRWMLINEWMNEKQKVCHFTAPLNHTFQNTCIQVSMFKCNHNNSRRSSQPVSVSNQFSVLAKLPEPTTRNETTSSEGRRTIDGSNYNYKRKQNHKRQSVRNNVNNNNWRTSVQHPTDCQILRHEPKDQDKVKGNLT